MRLLPLAVQRRIGGAQRAISWGLVDQGFSSATNFGLSIVAAQLLGPAGLGVVAIGFSAYLAVQSLHESLVVDPLVIMSSHLSESDRVHATRCALTIALCVGLATTVAFVSLGLLIPGPVGQGLLLFAPWTALAVLQDMWRAILFRDGRGRAAAANDMLWAVAMAAMVPVAFGVRGRLLAVATWGVGAAVAGLWGFAQTGLRPVGVRRAWRWWRTESWALGRWLGIETAFLTVGQQAAIIILASMLSASDVGGLRAAQAVFAPMTLLYPALSLPALPTLARKVQQSLRSAMGWATRISLLAVALVTMYVGIAALFRSSLLSVLFGSQFTRFTGLLLPIAIGQLLTASSIGFALIMRADRRGRSIMSSQMLGTVASLILAASFARVGGIQGATWGLVLGRGLGPIAVTLLALRAVSRGVPTWRAQELPGA